MAVPAGHLDSEPATAPANRTFLRVLAFGGVSLVALAIGLWSRYGTVVFMETMANAWAYCF